MLYSIILDTPEFIEKEYTTSNLERAKGMFELMHEDTDEPDYSLYLVEHTEDDDPVDLLEEDKGVISMLRVIQ